MKVFEIEKFLNENGIYGDVSQYENLPVVCVAIRWGDWKHEHGRCDYLMTEKLGYELIGKEVTEENGSDCYCADHFFLVDGLTV